MTQDIKKGEKDIIEGHKHREALLQAISSSDQKLIEKYKQISLDIVQKDKLNLFKRIPGNYIRSYKNLLLSHNTLYSYSAEKGGLHPATSHYMSEKYAIMIEHTSSVEDLNQLHIAMIDQYGEPSLRQTDKKPTLVNMVEDYIAVHFSENITVEEIAHKLHVHPSHLMREFKKEKGVTISQFRIDKRLKEAKELLLFSHLNITEISFMVGFSNVQYFTKVFKNKTGMTPKQYRK